MPSPLHILIVEDHALSRKCYQDLLREASNRMRGCRVDAVGTFEELQGRLDTDPPDVFITDLRLPDSHEFEATLDKLKSMGKERDLPPWLAMSAIDDDTLVEKTIKAGGDGFVFKKYFMALGVFQRLYEEVLKRNRRDA